MRTAAESLFVGCSAAKTIVSLIRPGKDADPMALRKPAHTASPSNRGILFVRAAVILFLVVIALFIVIPGMSKAAPGKRSSELEMSVSVEGNVERTEYSYNGVLTCAADKHYAVMIRTTDGNTVLEEYLDENGAPIKQTGGHYALLREYDENGNNWRTTYLDKDLKPVENGSGYCMLVCSFTEAGRVEYEHYLDAAGNPTKLSGGVYGRYYEYENGRNTSIVFLDADGEPHRTASGYAIMRRIYYEEGENAGRVEYEFYFDENGQPLALPNRQYGVHKEYDSLGRVTVLTYLGENGEPITTAQGYTTIRRTFYPDDTVESSMYYDLDGNQVALSQGQYGIRNVNGRTVYLDRNGRPIVNLYNAVENLVRYLNNHMLPVFALGALTMILSFLMGKKGNLALALLYLIFIACITVVTRREGLAKIELRVFWSYRQFFSSSTLRLQILRNILLFIPLGIILFHVSDRPLMLLAPVAVSLAIEAVQYFTNLGLAEIDDVISNGLGGAIGFGIGFILEPLRNRVKRKLSGYRRRSGGEQAEQ